MQWTSKLELNKIYCMDCLEGMKEIPDESIDLIITDPPYGINFKSRMTLFADLRCKGCKETATLSTNHVHRCYRTTKRKHRNHQCLCGMRWTK